MGGKGDRGGVWEECWGGMSLERVKRERMRFEGAIGEEVAGIIYGVPQHASYSAM